MSDPPRSMFMTQRTADDDEDAVDPLTLNDPWLPSRDTGARSSRDERPGIGYDAAAAAEYGPRCGRSPAGPRFVIGSGGSQRASSGVGGLPGPISYRRRAYSLQISLRMHLSILEQGVVDTP